MSDRVQCQNCGGRVNLPAGYSRAKIRCPGCGYYADVPAELRGAPGEEAPPPPPAPVRAAPVRRPDPTPAQSDLPAEEQYAFADLPPPPPKPPREAPAPAVARKAKPQPNPRDTRPLFDPDVPGGKPLLEGSQDEDDDRPYAVPGTGLKKCPHCRGDLPLDSTFCVHCGKELTSGAKAIRTFQPINRTWHEGWPPLLRIQLFIGLQVINAVAAVILLATSSRPMTDLGGLVSLVMTNLFQIGMQAFLVGSYDSLTAKRTAKGQATLLRTRRVAFIPFPPTKLPWRQSTNVGISGADVGCFPVLMCVYFVVNGVFYSIAGALFSFFLLGLAVIYFAVAAGFYWIVLRPSRFEVNLCDVYGSTDEVAFRSQDHREAEEVATTVAEATGLFYKPAQ